MAGNGYDDLISKLFMIDTKLREVCTHFKLKSFIPLKNTVAELEELSELLSSTLQNNKENSFQEKAKPYFLRENPLRSIRKDAMSLPFKELQNVSNNGSISKPLSKMKPNQSETRKMCDVCKLYDNPKMKSMKKCSNLECNMSWIHSDCIKTLNSLNQKWYCSYYCLPDNLTFLLSSTNSETFLNEKLYCICQRKSHGSMIACDYESCKNEWFHYKCVNITKTPKGKWFCPDHIAKY